MKSKINIYDFESGREYLNSLFSSINQENPRFSLRSFAQKIGIDQSTLVRYLASERYLSVEKTLLISKSLALSEEETNYFKLLTSLADRGEFELFNKLKKGFLFDKFGSLHTKQGELFLTEKSFILNFTTQFLYVIQDLKGDISKAEIVAILNCFFPKDEKEVMDVFTSLVQKGFLDHEEKSKRQKSLSNVFFPTGEVPREAGVNYHLDALKVTQTSLENFSDADMEIYTSLIPVKKEGRAKIHDAIVHLHTLISEYRSEEADDVYVISASMVNMTSKNSRPPCSDKKNPEKL